MLYALVLNVVTGHKSNKGKITKYWIACVINHWSQFNNIVTKVGG